MDEGSETSLCAHKFANNLGIKLAKTKVQMCTYNVVSKVNQLLKYIHIKGLDDSTVLRKIPDVLV